jgi:pimeloyl-ACP methyl ester carboxylesterase
MASAAASTETGSAATGTSTTAPAAPADIATTPIRVAATSAGQVAYREVGTGSPLVLIMGLGGTMDDWAPPLVNQLEAHFRVVVLDNAGVGKTAAVGPPLTITAMANQVSALISSLGLRRPAVLGWSMGGMIAQALAVLHPTQVSRLILAATQAGNGKALPVPPAAAAAAASTDPVAVLSVLFPPGQVAAARAYAVSLLEYPDFYTVTPAIKTEQTDAIVQWLAGGDAAGRAVGNLRLPTLVADGTVDALDPVANDRQLAGLVHGAQLVLYPGAGHAFLFQDESEFVRRVEAFLG